MLIKFIVFIIGLAIGSFLNVVIYRIPNKQSIIFPASHCPQCNNQLASRDLIPLISFIFNKGRCRYCNSKISLQYPVVELLTAVLFLLVFSQYQLRVQFFIYALLFTLLIAISVTDIKSYIIPNRITYFGVISGIILSIVFNHISVVDSLIGSFISGGFLLTIVITSKGRMGWGDAKLAAMIGSFIGFKMTILAIFLGSVMGSIIGITLKVRNGRSKLPFGPFIAVGTVVIVLWGDKLINWYLGLLI